MAGGPAQLNVSTVNLFASDILAKAASVTAGANDNVSVHATDQLARPSWLRL